MINKKHLALAVFSALVLTNSFSAEAAPAVPEPGVNLPGGEKDADLESDDIGGQMAAQGGQFYLHKVVVADSEISFNEAEMEAITRPYSRQVTDLSKLNAMTEEITRYLRSHGYPAAAAYIPEQEIMRSTLQVWILPGKIGEVKLNNQSGLKDDEARRLLSGVKPGKIITAKTVETALYNLNDLPGVEAAGLLSPGKDVGSSDLTVTIKDTKKAQTLLYAENYGNDNTGRYRYGLQETLNNLSGRGDMLRLGGLISNKNLRNYYAAYETNVGRSATTVGLSYSHMNYETGLDAFGMEGKADTFSLYGKTPLFHTAKHSLALTYGYDYRKLKDEFTTFNLEPERHSHGFHVGLEGTERRPGSALMYDLAVTQGVVGFDSDDAETLYGAADTKGSFTKANLRLTGVHDLGHNFDILLKAQGQWAGKNLDPSEKLYLGGAQGVRAYPQGEASGDEGFLATAEVRYHTKVPGLTFSAYLDGGDVKGRKNVNGSEQLLGWGIGVTYSRPNDWFARFDYARRIGEPNNASQEALAKQRMWFMVGKVF